jgi:hypothetical protein
MGCRLGGVWEGVWRGRGGGARGGGGDWPATQDYFRGVDGTELDSSARPKWHMACLLLLVWPTLLGYELSCKQASSLGTYLFLVLSFLLSGQVCFYQSTGKKKWCDAANANCCDFSKVVVCIPGEISFSVYTVVQRRVYSKEKFGLVDLWVQWVTL